MSSGPITLPSMSVTDGMSEFQLIELWDETQKNLAAFKEIEGSLRKKVFALKFAEPKEGTNTWDYGDGYVLKGTHKLARKFIVPEGFPQVNGRDPTIVDAVDSMIDELRACGNEGTFVADRLVKWTPTCSDSEYKKLSDKQREIVNKYLETKDGTPGLEFKRPSAT